MNKGHLSESEQLKFFEDFLQKFRDASIKKGEFRRYYRIADTFICLVFAGESLIPWLTPALEHLRVNDVINPDLVINLWDSTSTGISMIPPPCKRNDFTDRGDIWGFDSKRIKTAFHWSEYSVNVMDLATNIGVYWVNNADDFPYWVLSSPLRTLFHWWMEKNGCQLLHAAAIGTVKGTVLLPGKGGSGKSTTAVSCLRDGMFYLGDDYVIVRKNPEPIVYSLYCTAKINTDKMSVFPLFQPLIGRFTNEEQEKAVIFLYPEFQSQLIVSAPILAILVPNISGLEVSSIEPVSFWPVQRAMSFTTMSQLPGVGADTYAYINEFTSGLPCFTLNLATDLHQNPTLINEFLSNITETLVGRHLFPQVQSGPLISIIIPVYNSEKYIREALENVISQNYPAIELIVVDDGSIDRTKEMLDETMIDIRYFHNENQGPAAARNRGIRNATGDFIAFLDSDDLWPENNLQILFEVMQKEPELELVTGYAQLFKDSGNGLKEYLGNPKETFIDYIGAALYKRSSFQKTGLFDPGLRFGEDCDWYNRAREIKLKMKRLEMVTLLVRKHGGNMTKGKSMLELNALKVFKKAIDRRRAKNSKQ